MAAASPPFSSARRVASYHPGIIATASFAIKDASAT
jgi:hypothetical protein